MTSDSGSKPVRATPAKTGVVHESHGAAGNRPNAVAAPQGEERDELKASGGDKLSRRKSGDPKWCDYCQCYHAKPYPRVKDCKAKESEYSRRTGMIQDMLDYN